MDVLCKTWKCKSCKEIFRRDENLIKHLREVDVKEKNKNGGDTKFSSTACQWIEEEAVKTGKHVHQNIC